MAMECLEGETLAARIRRGALPLDLALNFAIQTADALDRAHRTGVVHRDSNSNIMLTWDGVKVLDFELARTAHGPPDATLKALTTSGALLGTPQYMSPGLVYSDDLNTSRPFSSSSSRPARTPRIAGSWIV